MTMRDIDAASYGWIHLFNQGAVDGLPEGWSNPHTADSRKLEGYFERVAVREKGHPSYDYARILEAHFKEIADSLDPWPKF
jgi:hypothetical protein